MKRAIMLYLSQKDTKMEKSIDFGVCKFVVICLVICLCFWLAFWLALLTRVFGFCQNLKSAKRT